MSSIAQTVQHSTSNHENSSTVDQGSHLPDHTQLPDQDGK